MIDALNFSTLWYYTADLIVLLSALAIILLWIQRKSLLDLRLMVVMRVFLTEVLISSFPVSAHVSASAGMQAEAFTPGFGDLEKRTGIGPAQRRLPKKKVGLTQYQRNAFDVVHGLIVGAG
jgi:hypothetical protein